VGSTYRQLSVRFSEHFNDTSLKDNFYQYIKNKKRKNFKINLIKEYPCTLVVELIHEERKMISEFKNRGHLLINTMLCEKKKTKPSIQIVQDVQFNKKNFQIKERHNSFRIQFRDNDGKKIHFQRRYEKLKSKRF